MLPKKVARVLKLAEILRSALIKAKPDILWATFTDHEIDNALSEYQDSL